MFLKRCDRRKHGKKHTYWVLVESYRTPRGSRHRIVAYLGALGRGESSGWSQLGRTLSGQRRTRPEPSLFDPPHYDEPNDDEPVLVKLKDIHLERLRGFGDVRLACGLWRLLELDVLLARIMPRGREEIPWPQMAAILTIARLCEPSSELHIEDTWYRGTALEDLFDLKYELLLYNITSTYFEGQCAANPLACRGYSRDSRPDCLQVLIGLVVTEDGFPLGYEVFAGNRNDSTTVDEVVTAMERKYGRANRVWVMDRGMVSEENIARLHRSNASYIVGTPKAMLRRFERELTDQRDWHTVQEGLDVKLVTGPDGKEVFILARSADRQAKEQAMHQRFVQRLENGLRKLEAAMSAGHLRDEGLANRRLGRMLERNWRASGAFDIRIERLAQPVGKARLKMTWERNPNWNQWASIAEGCYVLRTNLCGVDPVTLWKRYIQLTDAEWAFRIAKDELCIRPVWHQKEDRVRAHILVCFLAYVLWKTLAGWMQR